MSDWQAIETAPKDGTLILGRWQGIEYEFTSRPTHWMPLPAPPKVEP